MRWFLLVYTLFCLLLSSGAYIVFYGFQIEGVPLGTWHQGHDISYVNFDEFTNEVGDWARSFHGQSYAIEVENQIYQLECNRHFYLDLSRQKLWEDYQQLKNEVPYLQRVLQWVRLSWKRREYQFDLQVDSKRSEQTLVAWYEDRELARRLLQKVQTAFQKQINSNRSP